MHYYQYDGLLRDGQRKEHVQYVLKSPTAFKGKDVAECLRFQESYLRTVLKFDSVLVNKLTYLTEPMAETLVKQRGMTLNNIPSVEFCDLAPALHSKKG
jgi:hypothetical protein